MTVRTAFWVLLFFALSASSAAQVKGTVVLPESYSPTGTMTTLGEMATVSSENASLAKRIAAVIAVVVVLAVDLKRQKNKARRTTARRFELRLDRGLQARF